MDSDDRAENGGRKEKKTEDKDHDSDSCRRQNPDSCQNCDREQGLREELREGLKAETE